MKKRMKKIFEKKLKRNGNQISNNKMITKPITVWIIILLYHYDVYFSKNYDRIHTIAGKNVEN